MKHFIWKVPSSDNCRGVHTNGAFHFCGENLNCVSDVIYFHTLFGQPCRLQRTFSGLWVWVFWGKISDICEEMLGFVPLCPDTPPGCLWEGSTQEPLVCNARLKSTKFNFIFQHFFMESGNRWTRQRHSNVSNANQREETKAAIPTLVFAFAAWRCPCTSTFV